MKTFFVTYKENGSPKKATINEQRYQQLSANSEITDLIMYPTEIIMENNYNNIISSNGSTNKRILRG